MALTTLAEQDRWFECVRTIATGNCGYPSGSELLRLRPRLQSAACLGIGHVRRARLEFRPNGRFLP